MPIALNCTCGRSLRVKDEVAGKKIRCPACSTILPVPRPEAPKDAEEEAINLLLQEDSDDAPPSNSHDTADDKPATDAIQPPPRPGPRPPSAPEPPPPQWKWRKKRTPPIEARKPKARSGGGLFNNANTNWTVVGLGVFMMGGAVLWFIVGLFVGWIYFYPPILFLSGLLTFFKGLLGRSD